MADFSDHGQHCSYPYCNQKDFLPLTCDLCSKVLCREHLRYEDHECPHRARKDARVMLCTCCDKAVRIDPDEDQDLTLAKHMESEECALASKAKDGQPAGPPRCPVKGCKAKLTMSGSMTCDTCGLKVCLKHRFEDSHPCKQLQSKAHGNKGCRQEAFKSALARLAGLERLPGVVH